MRPHVILIGVKAWISFRNGSCSGVMRTYWRSIVEAADEVTVSRALPLPPGFSHNQGVLP